MKQSGIYRIVNTINGKGYVGSASYLQTRNNEHFNQLRKNEHYNYHLQAAWNRYREDNFTFEILEIIKYPTKKKLEAREQYWIDFYDSANNKKGYNIYPTAGNPLGKYKERILKTQKDILDFCKKYGYRPSGRSKDKIELKLASNLENYLDREFTENYFEFKKQVLKYPSKRNYAVIKNQDAILQFCKDNKYRPCEDTGSIEEQRLGSLLRAYMNMKRTYSNFARQILTYPNKQTKSVITTKNKILIFCKSYRHRPRAHTSNPVKNQHEEILGQRLGNYLNKNSYMYDNDFALLIQKFPKYIQFKKLHKEI